MNVVAKPVPIFTALSFGLAWLFALPLWFTGGLTNPFFTVFALAMMFTPAIAALIVVFFVEKHPDARSRRAALGLGSVRPVGRFLRYLALALVIPPALILAALVVGALVGVYPADFVNFSGFEAMLDSQLEALGQAPLPIPIGLLVAAQFLNVAIGALINTIPALGEELGWRGWLLPKLLPLGIVPVILISGVMWGLWHAPLILLGYNYPGAPGWLALTAMVGMTIVVGGVFSWLRIRSASVWPAALAHGSFNAAAGFSLIFIMVGESFDPLQASILGWTGWLVPLVLVIVLLATGQFRPASPQPVVTRNESAPVAGSE
ncbi:CAAX prenyl protease-like protein [Salinibacterium amurskyense]|uniref:CAAX prenyl protease-like protein n=1 Tax=Salinibacterium amurskyense TaxID=205941 RepID=A0A2M9D3M2_9MICO|nr:CPBP family intramembrane glutamic endopeptidase [Salinibacterium amurskyense]PJJ78643.1 CAAX prenyl protease-like protein [Salinibacterium amurskyense]RLQ80727.1 CPBP family intramembrane metalloprotease [Salinibacterium amurskyense]GHD83932.1 abortive infection protein [Salinibacterium amurskyense]